MEQQTMLQVGSDRMMARYVCCEPFTVKFAHKCEWQREFNLDNGVVYSQIQNKGTGAAVYRWGLRRGNTRSFRLGSTPQYYRPTYMSLRHV
jgi:hypothetical protein